MVVTEDIVGGKDPNVPDCSDDNFEDNFHYYRAECYRLKTFENWQKQGIIRKEDLARNGFYYLGTEDRVKCAFCNVVLRDWARGDNVEAEHRRHSRRCPLIVHGLGGAQNIPYNRTHSNEEPAYPHYADYLARLKTYEEYWPKSMKQRPKDLAAAGFFYTEKGDAVRCFQCAGLLRNWDPNDVPWEEHKHFFPRCPFLQQNNPSPRRDPVHAELLHKVIRQISQEYDQELVKKFEEYRKINNFPQIKDQDQYREEIEQFKQQTRVQQNTEPPDLAAAANSLASMHTHHYGASEGRDEIDCRTCVKCCESTREHHIMYPCSCTCCDKCVEHISECPSCEKRVRAALSAKKPCPDVASKPQEYTKARRNLGFGPSVHGMDE